MPYQFLQCLVTMVGWSKFPGRNLESDHSGFYVSLLIQIMITPASERDYSFIIELWELSVRASHHFLPEDYIQEIKVLLPVILPQVQIYVWRNDDGIIKGFAGVAGQKIEMLFINPDSMGQGLGRKFAEFCIHTLKADKVDVNEHNEKALGFYKKIGYRQIGRQELDTLGRPFPLIEMQYFPTP